MQDCRERIHHAQSGMSDQLAVGKYEHHETSHINCPSMCQVLGVSRKSSSVTLFTFEDGFIRSAVAEETHSLGVNARRSVAAEVVSR